MASPDDIATPLVWAIGIITLLIVIPDHVEKDEK